MHAAPHSETSANVACNPPSVSTKLRPQVPSGQCRRLWRKALQAGFVLAIAMLGAQLAHGAEPTSGIRIDSKAARRTVEAVTNPRLTRTQALSIADLPGNKALIQQAIDFGVPATRDTFADALIAAAQGSDAFTIFNFKEVRTTAATSRAGLEALASNHTAMVKWITQRIEPFTPPGVPVTGRGYIVAGGPGGGFSLKDGGIYVNISRAKGDLNVVRLTLAHELYHDVQHAAEARAGTLDDFNYDEAAYKALPPGAQRACYATRQLFGDMMKEGAASYIGDIALYPTSGDEALSDRKQRAASLSGDVEFPISMLDIGLAAMTSDDPVSERKVYTMGFLQAGQLYYDIAYVMAKAIVQHDGPAALGDFIAKPGNAFIRRYGALSHEPHSTLPKLGERAEQWAARKSCIDPEPKR